MDLEARRNGIGGSDVGAILGLASQQGSAVYRTATEVWNDKVVGYKERKAAMPDDPATCRMWWGKEIEPVVIKAYEVVTGAKVKSGDEIGQLSHLHEDFLIANVDGIARTKDGKDVVFESKNIEYDMHGVWGESGTDRVPVGYFLQVQHYMHVTGLKEAHIAAKISGVLKVYIIKKDESLMERVNKKLNEFWNKNVLKKIAPEPQQLSDVRLTYKADNEQIRSANQSDLHLIDEIKRAEKKVKEYKSFIECKKTDLASKMGECGVLKLEEERLATFKENKNGVRSLRLV